MKTRAKLLVLCPFLIAIFMVVGCNKSPDSASASQGLSTMDAKVDDVEVTLKVKTALLRDEMIKGFNISVVTTKGDVRITGIVDNQAQLDQVDKVVRSIEGVHSVHDELSIKK